jgi:cullin-associated NEDD8-dissociated protein 1
VVECLGKLCLMSPPELLPKLKASLASPSALMRTTVVTAMKFTISDQPQTIDQLLRAEIGRFLATLRSTIHKYTNTNSQIRFAGTRT